MGKPLVTASALGFSAYAAACCGGKASLRAVFPDLPDRSPTCATGGVLGPVVATIGALQAPMAFSLLLGIDPSPLGQLVSFDAKTLRMGGFRFGNAPEPPNALPFIAHSHIRSDDLLIGLRTGGRAPL